ncbi:glutathione binding-like protein [Sneathiella aquimaris]|uniref:glutathione binding-like protein n=1 Tax=Sneathiella aquimaris TaxID=2599305 RepID=UPI00146E793F|nr:glutathione binding-like protein [Sneathiella aquimaris]
MKLYIRPRSGSLAPHIALHEAGARFFVDIVDTVSKKTATGEDYLLINKMGYVPTLELDNGAFITEGPAILSFIADYFPAAKLSPQPGTVARAHMNGYLNFVAAEIHKSFSPFFAHPPLDPENRQKVQAVLNRKIDYINNEFSDGRDYLMGRNFSVADAYLLSVLRWLPATDNVIENWPFLADFMVRAKQRPAVREAMIAEGIEDEL